jgi:hypothetical protein
MLCLGMRGLRLWFYDRLHLRACWVVGWSGRKRSVAENQFIAHQIRNRGPYNV